MNEFDQFIKHTLKIKNYARYTDDFVIISSNEKYLKFVLPKIKTFFVKKLQLEIHPNKIILRKYLQGIDFLGYIILPHYRLVRTKTRKRIFKKLKNRVDGCKNATTSKESLESSLNSYLGVLSHANEYKFSENLKNNFWFWLDSK